MKNRSIYLRLSPVQRVRRPAVCGPELPERDNHTSPTSRSSGARPESAPCGTDRKIRFCGSVFKCATLSTHRMIINAFMCCCFHKVFIGCVSELRGSPKISPHSQFPAWKTRVYFPLKVQQGGRPPSLLFAYINRNRRKFLKMAS